MIKWALILVIIVIVMLFTFYEWPKIDKSKRRDKWAFILLTMMGAVLGVLLIYFPNMPGPTEWVDAMLKPWGKYLE